MKNSSFMALAKKEFFNYVNSPLAYVVIVPFLLISSFLYFRTAFIIGDANLRPFIEMLPWFLIVVAPALAMRSLNDEQKNDTLELLYAHPMSEWVIVGAKYIGLMGFYFLMLATTAALPMSLILFSSPDYGLMLSQYLGAFLTGAVFLAVGIMASALVRNVIGSFLLGVAINFCLILLGLNFVLMMVPGSVAQLLQEATVMSHIMNVSRGVIDLRDLVYFGTVIGLVLSIAVVVLSERKVSENSKLKRQLHLSLGLLVAVGVVLHVALYEYPIRLDMTADGRYSLSKGTKQLLRELPDRVSITLYSSPNIPGSLQVTVRETNDRLQDFSRYSNKLDIRQVKVNDALTQQEAREQGIREVSFNQIGSGSFQVQQGFLGLKVRFADKTDLIDFIDDATDLEYQLARIILNLTREEKSNLGYLNTSVTGQFGLLEQLLSQNYQLDYLSAELDDDFEWDASAVIVVDDGISNQATAAARLRNYSLGGGNVLLMADGVSINQQMLTTTVSLSEIASSMSDWGLRIEPDLVYDIQRNEPISLGQGSVQYIVPYPFWLRAEVNTGVVPWLGSANNVLLGWPSSISIEIVDEVDTQIMMATSKVAGRQTDTFNISPDSLQTLQPQGELLTLGVISQKDAQRVVAIANTHWVSDQFMQNTPENVAFFSNLVDWVAADDILSSIPKRTSSRNLFTFASTAQAGTLQWISLIAPSILVASFGFWWLKRRRHLTQREYTVNS